MNRDTLITVLLAIAGIVLAFVMFWAGARWKSKTSERSAASTTADAERFVAPHVLKETDILHVTSS